MWLKVKDLPMSIQIKKIIPFCYTANYENIPCKSFTTRIGRGGGRRMGINMNSRNIFIFDE